MKDQKAQNERKSNPKRQIFEKEKLQNLKGTWQFWTRSWRDGPFGRFKRPK